MTSPRCVCLAVQTLSYVEGGGFFWVYLNWALGFHRAGMEVYWMEILRPSTTSEQLRIQRAILEARLKSHGLPARIVFVSEDSTLSGSEFSDLPSLSDVAESADLLVSLHYRLPDEVARKFRNSVLIDIDPGLLQYWVSTDCLTLATYTHYFSISDAIGRPGNPIPDLGIDWKHTPPCVDTRSWPVVHAEPSAPYTTISHWEAIEYVVDSPGSFYDNTKKIAFEPFLTLPSLTSASLELAICLDPANTEEWQRLRDLGWKVRPSQQVSSSPEAYQSYVQHARGEFSICKPSYRKMESGWISDRTLCFLASGKPVVVQNTGRIDYIAPSPALRRFSTLEEAARNLLELESDYKGHSQAARHLAETVFDAQRVAERLLNLVL